MNDKLQKFAREELKIGLHQLSAEHQLFFKRMYSPSDLNKNINAVVEDMAESKLDHAMMQVKTTLEKIALEKKNRKEVVN